MRFIARPAAIVASAIASSAALAGGGHHEGDIAVYLTDARITTGVVIKQNVFEERVFGAEFGDPIFNFTSDPGFDAEDGTFPPNTLVGFNIRAALGVWNGNGFDVSPETMTINFGPLQVETSDGFVEGFGLRTDGGGGWHRHLGFTINDVEKTDSDIYLLELELWHESDDILDSKPFWMVFNLNAAESEHDAAIDWVRLNLVSEIAALTDIVLLDGVVVAGGLEELAASDDAYFETEARVTGEVHQPHLLRLRATAATNAQNATALDLRIEGRITDVEAQTTVLLRDWQAGQFEQVDQFTMGISESIHDLTVPDAARFIRATDGRIRVEIEQIVFFPFTLSGFHTLLDHLELRVR